MNKTVWKYKLSAKPFVELEMPIGAQILSVQSILNIADPDPKELAYLWAMVDPEMRLEKRRFIIIPTGVEMGDDVQGHSYVGTIQMQSGDIILHVFEVSVY